MVTETMTGADVAALRDLAGRMETGARRLDTLSSQLRAQLAAAPWRGERADAYRQEFTTRHAPALRALTQLLQVACTQLRRQADEQDRASSAGGGALAGGIGAVMAALSSAFNPQVLGGLGVTLTGEQLALLRRSLGGVSEGDLRTFLASVHLPSLQLLSAGSEAVRQAGSSAQDTFDGGLGSWQVSASALLKATADAGLALTPKGLKALAEAGVQIGGHAAAGVEQSAFGGLLTWRAEAAASADAHAGGSVELSPQGLAAAASVGAMVGVAVSTGARVGTDSLNLSSQVAARAQAGADAGASANLGSGGAVFSAGAQAGAMAEVTATESVHVGPVRASAAAHASVGVGAHADVGGALNLHQVRVKADVGAALGVGTGVAFDVSVDPAEAARDIAKEATKWWGHR